MSIGPTWLASADRTVPLFDYAASAPLGRIPTPVPLAWPVKSPADLLDYTVDGTEFLTATNDSIASAAAVDSLDLTVLAVVIVGLTVVVWLAAGSPGTHTVTVTVTTLAGEIIPAEITLPVASLPPALAPILQTLTTESGAPLETEAAVALIVASGQLGASVTLPDGTSATPQAGITQPS